MIPVNLNKKADESELQYIWRLALAKYSGSLDMTWEELADIFNENLGDNYGSSAYRKKFQQAQHFYDDVFSKMDNSRYYFKKGKKNNCVFVISIYTNGYN